MAFICCSREVHRGKAGSLGSAALQYCPQRDVSGSSPLKLLTSCQVSKIKICPALKRVAKELCRCACLLGPHPISTQDFFIIPKVPTCPATPLNPHPESQRQLLPSLWYFVRAASANESTFQYLLLSIFNFSYSCGHAIVSHCRFTSISLTANKAEQFFKCL